MKKAIKQKLLNLVTIDPKDYCVRTQLSQRHIDILKYVKKEQFSLFISKEVSQLEISTASGVNYFEDVLQNCQNTEEFIQIIEENGFELSESMLANIKGDFKTNKTKVMNHFISEMKQSKKKFVSLNRLAKQFYNDSAIWPLHIAYQFLKGKISDEVSIKSPLILQKVEIIEEGSKIFLRRIEDEFLMNEKLQVILNKEYPNHVLADELFKNMPLNETIERIESMIGYQLDKSTIETLNLFTNEDSKKLAEKYNKLMIESSAILGFFEPEGSSLKQDLEKIIELNVDPFESQMDGQNFKSNKYYEDKIVKEPDLLQLNHPLNIFQKYAVSSALQQSTLIYGPPGTGKSEVISNIISNALIKGKNVLMVSEKKAALDVLTNRIKSLSQFTLYLCDNRNREEFYKKIDSLNNILGTQWYREPSRYSRNAQIEPLKIENQELMFFNNYKDLYKDLLELVKKHWNVEDYEDKIFEMDYVDYQNLKNDLGDQICKDWLEIFSKDSEDSKNVYEKIQEFLVEYNISKIDDFFTEYLKFKKFIKKYKLEEEFSSNEIIKHIKKMKQKIASNNKLVEGYLLGGKKLATLFETFFKFREEYQNSPTYIEFTEKPQKQKESFLNWIDEYLVFFKKLFNKKPEWKEKSKDEIIAISESCFNFYEKHKKEINKNGWFSFFETTAKKLPAFIERINTETEQSVKEIIFTEFVLNRAVINDTNTSDLSFKIIKDTTKNMNETLEMFNDYLEVNNSVEFELVEDLIRFKDFIKYDEKFLNDLYQVRNIFTPLTYSMVKEYSWLSLPYLKPLYLENFILFDLKQVEPVVADIKSPINAEQFDKLKKISLWNEIIKINPAFLEIRGVNLQDIITQLRREELRSSTIVEEMIFKKYINSLRNYLIKLSKEEKDDIANVLRIASSGKLPPITPFVQRFYSSLKKLFPVWVARPDNVADMIPLNENEFYYGIFDEASQMSIERAYPLVYRTKIKVVSGDDKQLKPSSFFAAKVDDNDFDLDDFDSVESLLERAKVSWWNEFHLKNHYRSESKELIEFSNKFIYNESLEVATKCDVNEKGIDVIDVKGTWNQVNKEEANKVLELLENHYDKYEKILIITFNSKQSQLVENMLIEKHASFPESLKKKLELNQVIVTNLENVQGNEGDLVILSISYGRNPEGVIRNNFGPLNSRGGSNRLNVAITRARSKMIVVKSLNGEDIKVANSNNKNAIIFKKFIEYLDVIKNNQDIDVVNAEMENVDEINEGTQEIVINQVKTREISPLEFAKPIVRSVYGELIKSLGSKYNIEIDFKVGSKNIDLLIKNKKTNKAIKALIIDEWRTNRTTKDMIEDIDRQYFLEDRGYSTFKIREYEWHSDKARIIEKIKYSMQNNDSNKLDYIVWQTEK